MALIRVLQPDETCPKPIYTDADMCDPALRQEIEESVRDINKLRYFLPPLPEDWELVLELEKDDETGEYFCSYYFVRHSTRCLFWLHEFDLESVLAYPSDVSTDKAHIRKSAPVSDIHQTKHMTRLGITSLVSGSHVVPMASHLTRSRSHWEMFPHNREVPEDLFQELSGILFHAGIGTSGASIGCYDSRVTQTA